MEVGVVIDKEGQPIFWHEPAGRSVASLPDSHDLWTFIWQNRERVGGFAHSHPGSGVPGPSHEDVTTFAAIEAALGRRLNWWITSRNGLVLVHHLGMDAERLAYGCSELPWLEHRLVWLQELRDRSYG